MLMSVSTAYFGLVVRIECQDEVRVPLGVLTDGDVKLGRALEEQ